MMRGKRIGVVVLVTAVLLAACKRPCEKYLDVFCAADPTNCDDAKFLWQGKSSTPERERFCKVQLEELDRLPRPHTRAQLFESGDRASWLTSNHPARRVEGLPTGYAPGFDWFWQDGFSMVLQSANEPLLREVGGDSFRFLHLPALSRSPFVVRATRTDRGVTIEWKHLAGSGDVAFFSPTTVAISATRQLTTAEWADLTMRIRLAQSLSSRMHSNVSDGAEWLLESVVDGGYAMTWRRSPDEHPEPVFRDACLTLLSLGTPDGGYDGLGDPYTGGR